MKTFSSVEITKLEASCCFSHTSCRYFLRRFHCPSMSILVWCPGPAPAHRASSALRSSLMPALWKPPEGNPWLGQRGATFPPVPLEPALTLLITAEASGWEWLVPSLSTVSLVSHAQVSTLMFSSFFPQTVVCASE